jgi:hypothetical protein
MHAEPATDIARRHLLLAGSLAAGALTLGACATGAGEPVGSPRKEFVLAATGDGELIRFNAGQPQRVLQRLPLQGLAPAERLVGMDFRVSRGQLYALTSQGRLLLLDTRSGRLAPAGSAAPVVLSGQRFGFDFNPVADRIRVVSDSGQNLRLHPDTGALVATDPPLSWADPATGGPLQVAGAGYTYNKQNDKITSNYAIDLIGGRLLLQGSLEGVQPPVSPNTGRLGVVGALGTGALEDAAFDITDTDNTALAALRQGGRTRLYVIDLASGRASPIGTVAQGQALWGLAIEP